MVDPHKQGTARGLHRAARAFPFRLFSNERNDRRSQRQSNYSAHHFDVEYRMDFVPVMIVLAVVAADAVDAHAAADRRRLQADRLDDLADDEAILSVEVVDQLEGQIAVFIVDAHFADVAFGDDVRLGVAFDVADADGLKLAPVSRRERRPTARLFFRHGAAMQRDEDYRQQNNYGNRRQRDARPEAHR